jgi:hypothetical protein
MDEAGKTGENIGSANTQGGHSSNNMPHPKCPDEKLGFIMFECGLEGISLKGVKNSEALPKIDDKEETVSVTICNELSGGGGGGGGGSTPNLGSTVETLASDKEANILGTTLNSKEDIMMMMTDCNVSTPGKQSLLGGGTESFQLPSQKDKDKEKQLLKVVDLKKSGSASVSCVIQFKIMWYNFAAPPQTPITRKIDYTR